MNKTLARYTFVKYCPDPSRGEFVNIGVILHSPERRFIDCAFLTSFARVKALDPTADSKGLHQFAKFWKSALDMTSMSMEFGEFPQLEQKTVESDDFLQFIAGRFDGTLTFSDVRATYVADLQSELQSLYNCYVQPPVISPGFTISSTALAPKQTRDSLVRQFDRRGLISKDWVRPNYEVQGTEWPHMFDLGLRNGHDRVIQSLALDVPIPEVKIQRAMLLGAMVEDARAKNPDIEADAVVKPPAADSRIGYDESLKYLTKAGVAIHPVDNLGGFLDSISEAIKEHEASSSARRILS